MSPHRNRQIAGPNRAAMAASAPRRRPAIAVSALLLVVVLGSMPACGVSSVSAIGTLTPTAIATATSTLTPTATAVASPTSLPTATATRMPPPGYHADQATGWAGWKVSGPWKIDNGVLINDGSGSSGDCGNSTNLLAPYLPPSKNYAVEVVFQVPQNYNANGIGIIARVGSSQNQIIGYSGLVGSFGHIYDLSNCNQIARNGDFTPGTELHTMRFELNDTEMHLYMDGGLLVAASDAKYLSAGRVGIFCNQEYIKVSSFSVTLL